jgi:hypothetical protein
MEHDCSGTNPNWLVPSDTPALERLALSHKDRADYESHIAYQEFIEQATFSDKLRSAIFFSQKSLLLVIKRLIRYEMIPFDIRNGSKTGLIAAGISNFLRPSRKKAVADPGHPIYRKFRDSGCLVSIMSDDQFDALVRCAEPEFEKLQARRDRNKQDKRAFDDSRATVSRRNNPEMYARIETIFEENGIMEVASKYLNRQVKLVDVNPQINDPSDRFWLDIFTDLGIPKIPDTAYFHRDASGGDLKAIIYMSDVNAENGPFNYVVGSNKIRLSKIDNLICEANDQNGLSGTDRQSRKTFSALPSKLRQKGSFGNDINDGSAFADCLLKSNWRITGQRGSVVLFDTKGVHRGGMIESGERRVITCVLG